VREDVGVPRPVCTLNGADESAMNRLNVVTLSPLCSIKNKYYESVSPTLQDHARNRLIRDL
jgi:hypothetical protein